MEDQLFQVQQVLLQLVVMQSNPVEKLVPVEDCPPEVSVVMSQVVGVYLLPNLSNLQVYPEETRPEKEKKEQELMEEVQAL